MSSNKKKRAYQDAEGARKRDLHEQVELNLRAVIAHVILFNYRVAEEVGLSARDMQLIHLLQLRGSMTAGELARATGLTTGSVTTAIDRLEDAGYASRQRGGTDRRKVSIVLDEARLGAELAPHYAGRAAHLHAVADTFTADQLETVAAFLAALADDDSRAG